MGFSEASYSLREPFFHLSVSLHYTTCSLLHGAFRVALLLLY